MKLTMLSSEAGLTRVQSEGEITLLDVQSKANPLEALLGPGGFAGKVLLNLSQSSFIDSAGVGWLVMSHKRFCDSGGLLVVHSLAPMVCHVFKLLGVGTVLHVADNEAAAVEVARTAPPCPPDSPPPSS
jgi:anti-anti-sigma factor